MNNNYHYVGTVAETADGEFLFEDPEITFVKEDIFSWGAVAKLPKEWNPFLKPEFYNNNNLNVTQYTNEVIRDWEVIKAQEGTFSPEVRKWRLNAVLNYDFQEGFLQGFGVGFSTRYQSRVAIGFPTAPVSSTTRSTGAFS